MIQKIYQVDAFAGRVFTGNPAAVCPLEKWLPDPLLQQIAMENNLAETAFYVKREGDYHIRWFTPTIEVDLCGHATLASAFVLFYLEGHMSDEISFYSERSGKLGVRKDDNYLTLDFPSDKTTQAELSGMLLTVFDVKPLEVHKGKTDYMFVFESAQQILDMKPDFERIGRLDARGAIVTARGTNADFVCRFFAPQSGIDEDPVTGSAYTTLTPYWAEKLGRNELSAMQLSARGGQLKCRYLGERVEISGQAKLYLKGEIFLG